MQRSWLTWPLVAFSVLFGAPATSAQGSDRESLETLLERSREARAGAQASLRLQIERALAPLEGAELPYDEDLRRGVLAALEDLGVEAGPLLVPALDPRPPSENDTSDLPAGASEAPPEDGASEPDADSDPALEFDRARASVIAEGLGRINSVAITDDLLALLASGSPDGRALALRVLETCPEPARARPAVTAIFESETGPLRQAALRALVRLRDPANAELLRKVLTSDEASMVSLALDAILEAGETQAAGEVFALLANSSRAGRHARRLIAFYRAHPELVSESVLDRFVAVARSAAPVEKRILVLESLPDLLARGSTSGLRKILEPVTRTSDRQVREAAQVALVRLGDRGARRDLLKSFDAFVDKNDRFPEAYVRRGELFLRIQDWDDAIRDFQQAVRLARDDPRPQPDAYIGMARAYARRGKLRDAAEWIRKAPLSMAKLRELERDPDFVELRASKFGKEAFGS